MNSAVSIFYLWSVLGEVLTPFQQFSKSMCGTQITISYQGKTASATVDDEVNFLCHSILFAPCLIPRSTVSRLS
jgi:hypothetical protein